ncbi:MAG: hypothetical protein PSV18_10425 [Methylobacter sp.]|nr:hypothetical protein [Candidatus Methylobacter titanis]
MKVLKIILIVLVFVMGLTFGVVIDDFPRLTLNKEVRLFEPLSFMLTATIGLLIPFFVKRWIDDSRQLKNNLINELRDTLREVETIRNKIKYCYFNNSIGASDKQEIIILFEESDLKINCLEEQFIESFDKETKEIRKEINKKYINYWKYATGGELMSNKFISIDEGFYRKHNVLYTEFETKIKQAINKIHII